MESMYNLIFLFIHGLFSGLLLSGSAPAETSFIKGMTVSCQTWGYEWATPEMKQAMEELKLLGVNAISIHPYARVYENGHLRSRLDKSAFHVTTPIKWAGELGILMMLKPHLAYWGTKFKWRGDIRFEEPGQWTAFFADYSDWIVTLAELAEQEGAQIFCIGTELRHSLPFESDWRQLIKSIRKVYHGKLTYAANWDSYRLVPFWDELDFIGIQAYFPLTDSNTPGKEEISTGWDDVLVSLQSYSEQINKKIIFTEIGYDMSENAASKPWLPQRSENETARLLQESCLEIALRKAGSQSCIAGLFLWKWFPEYGQLGHHEDYNLQRPEIKELIKKMWL